MWNEKVAKTENLRNALCGYTKANQKTTEDNTLNAQSRKYVETI